MFCVGGCCASATAALALALGNSDTDTASAGPGIINIGSSNKSLKGKIVMDGFKIFFNADLMPSLFHFIPAIHLMRFKTQYKGLSLAK